MYRAEFFKDKIFAGRVEFNAQNDTDAIAKAKAAAVRSDADFALLVNDQGRVLWEGDPKS